MKFKTIREGEQALIQNIHGEGKVLEGPARVFLFRERLQKLRVYTATPNEYLTIKDNTGLVTHKPGPCYMFMNPLEHSKISVAPAIVIDSSHLIVVYRKKSDNSVERRIIQEPTIFVPSAEEWMHDFCWHGADKADKTRMIPGYHKFQQLDVIPSQFYYNVREVRTIDDTMITVKLMIFFEMTDVIKMLETTHDPMADMINAVCADVISFAGKINYQGFLKQTSMLSQLSTYPQLQSRAERIGFGINKVVFRGYHASDQLQAMQDSAIKSRTELRLNAEIQEQKQKIVDYKLTMEQDRTKLKQEIDTRKQEHQQKTAVMKQSHDLRLREQKHQTVLEMSTEETKAKMECQAAKRKAELEYLEKLKALDVDMTKYLVNQQGAEITEQIEIVSGTTSITNRINNALQKC